MTKITLSDSVGLGGKNLAADIKTIQHALNQISPGLPTTPKLAVDGRLGPRPEHSKTVAAIKRFQQKTVGMAMPDGRIDVNGKTHRKINILLPNKTLPPNWIAVPAHVKKNLRENLEQYEGRLNHMYLDTRGNTTIGVGHLINNEESAKSLNFIHKSTKKPASIKEIITEYCTIKSKPYGARYPAWTFEKAATLIISDDTINQLRDRHIDLFERELKTIYGKSQFSNFPANVQLALFDMIFNLGMPRLSSQFLKFNRHITNNNWEGASHECKRKDISDDRNFYVKNLLMTEARKQP